MTLVNIRAAIDCDRCGKRFHVEIDPTDTGNCAYDMVIDNIDTGLHDDANGRGFVSMHHAEMLCVDCTRVADGEEEADLAGAQP